MLRRCTAAVALCLGAATVAALPATAASASPAAKQATKTVENTIDNGLLVSPVPASGTPDINANSSSFTAYPAAFAQIPESTGDPEMIVGGTFHNGVEQTEGGTSQPLNWIFAIDANTGTLAEGFQPGLNGSVRALLPGPTLTNGDPSVYVGGDFTQVGGTTVRHLALLDANTGARVSSFKPPVLNASVHALAETTDDGGQLLVGGVFTTAGGKPANGLISLDATTGALTGYLSNSAVAVTGHHNYGVNCQPGGSTKCVEAPVGVNAMSISPNQQQLAITGNFTRVGGQPRNQIALLSLGSSTASVSNWATPLYDAACDYWAYDSYVRDVQFSPDGSYFAVTATGGGSGTPSRAANGGCDSAARFEATGTGSNVQPTWIDFTGQDTTYGLAVSNSAVYVGGHYRWMNNPNGPNYANLGAVPRPALSALDPVNGIPYSWNPGKNPRGIDTFALYLTSQGLWAGYNTDYIGNHKYFRGQMAFFPYTGGESLPGVSQPGLPGTVYQGTSSGLAERSYGGGNSPPGAPTEISGGSAIDWTLVHGAFMINGNLYYLCAPANGAECDANKDEGLFEASFNGSSFGTPTWVQPFNDPNWEHVLTGSGGTTPDYVGLPPPLYDEASHVTGLTYVNGAIYYTMSGSSSVYYTFFEPEDGIVGGSMGCPSSDTDTGCISSGQFTVGNPSNVNFTGAQGLFASGTDLYWADSSGELEEVPLTVPAAGPATLAGTSTVVNTATNWGTPAIFLGPDPATASFTYSCNSLTCAFTGSGQAPSGATITNYAWSFGDGTSTSGGSATTNHTYAAAGSYPVTLTITDSAGDTASTSQTVTVGPSPTVTFDGAAGTDPNSANPSVTIPSTTRPGDTLLAFLTLNSSTVTASLPSGWSLLASKSVNGMQSLVYTETATSGDPGSKLAATISGTVRADLQVAAYDVVPPTGQAPAVQAAAASDAATANHTTPTVTTLPGDQVLSYWSAKSPGPVTWAIPAGQTLRDAEQPTTGKGLVSSALADYGNGGYQGAPGVGTDSAGGQTATTSASTPHGISWSVVLGSGTSNGSRTARPAASIAGYSCRNEACGFTGAGQAPSGATITTYAWSFGDGKTVSGSSATASHTYPAYQSYPVTLTVTDSNGNTASATRTVTVAPSPTVAFHGATGTDWSTAKPTVTIPSTVAAGDTLLALLTLNSSTVQASLPQGWSLLAVKSVNGMQSRIYTKTASSTDHGRKLTATLSGTVRADLQVAAYHVVPPTGQTTALRATATLDRATAAHTTATVTTTPGDQVLSYWSAKSAGPVTWTTPAGQRVRNSQHPSKGSGLITSVLADYGRSGYQGTSGVGTDSAGGLTGRTSAATTIGISWSIVLGGAS
jgi:PKD repeat protein